MKNLENYGVLEMGAKEITEIEGGFLLGTSGVSWGNFWKGVGIGSAIGGSLYIAQQYA
jgi:hypothetical protein